ncbi:hypothetical protein [Aeromonas caviae]|uniref:hypothetical protein n=1 Tax=Aeromonas caviae TaxID=648 RepID=UPI0029D98734|nr:hypothetical protein [Aeromonas caviae]MDX7844629.1 hypothetical protein [Aeromonas caviae]
MTAEQRFLEQFSKNLSNKKRKKVKSLSKSNGLLVSTALYGSSRTSDAEIHVVSALLKEFNDIELYAFKTVPNKVILKAKTQDGHRVLIHPQYRVPKPLRLNGENLKKQDYWYVDLAIEIFDKNTESVVIGIWAMEYDGHPEHFTESGIKRGRFRDMVINTETDIFCIHVTKEMWASDQNEYISNMLRFIERRTRDASFMSLSDLKLRDVNLVSPPELEIVNDNGTMRAISWELAAPEENT